MHVAQLLHFIKVPHPSDPAILPLRIAICSFHETKSLGTAALPLYKIKDVPTAGEEYYPVDTATIERRLAVAFARVNDVDDGEPDAYNAVYGMTYNNQTTR